MPSLLIRNVDPALHAELKARAAAHHRSLQEEVHVLLRAGLTRADAATRSDTLVTLAQRLFGSEQGIDLELPTRDRSSDRAPPNFAADA